MIGKARAERGVSLIEALVAMAAMAFGMLGVVGLQSTLRMNADIAKQRSEAVRIAQETVESRRTFSTIATDPLGVRAAFDDIVSDAVGRAVVGTNATFTVFETVTAAPVGIPSKLLAVRVDWSDRLGQAQSVFLTTNIARVSPELSGALSIWNAGSPMGGSAGRNKAIPSSSVDLGNGTSRFDVPGASPGTSWIFSNSTGYITERCDPTCSPFAARLLAGFVRYSTGVTQPTPANAENPTSAAIQLQVYVDATSPTTTRVDCFQAPVASTFMEYFCAVPVGAGTSWSGRSKLDLAAAGLTEATSIASPTAGTYRVCRYTPVRAHSATGLKNQDHPLDYTSVTTSLVNQNFLVILGGDGALPFDCPADDTATPRIDGNTYHHQPSV